MVHGEPGTTRRKFRWRGGRRKQQAEETEQRLAAIEGHLTELSNWAMAHDEVVDARLGRLETWATEDADLIAEVTAVRDELRRRRMA
jgi:hypothetical protein